MDDDPMTGMVFDQEDVEMEVASTSLEITYSEILFTDVQKNL